MATGANTLEYIISIVFNQGQVRGATQAMDALEKKAAANADAMKKLGTGNREIDRSYSDATQKINGVMTPLVALTQKFKDNKGQISEVTRYYERHGRTVQEVTSMTESSIVTMGKHTQSIGALAAGFAKLALRAAVVVPIWMIIRTIFGTLQKLITDSLTTWVDLSKEMARVGSTGQEAAQNMALLKNVVLDFSRNSSRGFKEAASAMYQLGSAGLSVQEMIQGMPAVMNLAIASFADTEQTAKLVAGAYNVFGNSIQGAYTVSEKFKNMSDILAYTYAKQQVELEDISNAMSYVASAAGLMNVDFGDLVTTIGVLNTGLLRGSKAGVALMNSFIQIAQESSKLAQLGVVFDPSKPLDFVDVVDQLHKKYGDAALSLNNLKEIMDVFGQRGGRAMAQLIADYNRWKEAIGDARKNYKDFAEDMAEVAQKSLPGAWEKMWNSMKANMISSLKGTEDFFIKTLENMAKAMERGAFLKEFRDRLSPEAIGMLETGTDEERDALMKKLAIQKELWTLEKQVKAELEVEQLSRGKIHEHAKSLNDVIKDTIDKGGQQEDIQKAIRQYIIDANGEYQMSADVLDRIVKKQMEQVKLQKAANEAALDFTITELNAMRDMENAVKYEKMRASGAQDSYVAYVELNDLIANSNSEIKKFNDLQAENAKDSTKKVEANKDYLDIQTVINSKTNEELLVLKAIGGQENQINKIIEARNALITKMYAQQMEYAMKLRSDMSSVFKDVLMGEEDIRNTGLKIGDAMRDSIAQAIGNSLSMGILQTGLGEQFGAMGVAFENMFSGPGGMFTTAIVQGVKTSAPTITTAEVDGHTQGAAIVKKAIIDGHTEGAKAEATTKAATVPPPPPPPAAGTPAATAAALPGLTATPSGQTLIEETDPDKRMAMKSILSLNEPVIPQKSIADLKEEIANLQGTIDSGVERIKKLRSGEELLYNGGADTPLRRASQEDINALGSVIATQKQNLQQLQKELGDQYAKGITDGTDVSAPKFTEAIIEGATQASAMLSFAQKQPELINIPGITPAKTTESRNAAKDQILLLRDEITAKEEEIARSIASLQEARQKGVITTGKGTAQEYFNNLGYNIAQQKQELQELKRQMGVQYVLATPDRTTQEDASKQLATLSKDMGKSVQEGAEKGSQAGTAAGAVEFTNALNGFMQSIFQGGGGAGGMVSGAAGVFGAAGGMGAIMPFMNTPIGGTAGWTLDAKTGKYVNSKGKAVPTYGNLFGGMVTGGLMGYSQYQSMTSRGANPMYAGISGGLMGMGGFLTSMGMASMANPMVGGPMAGIGMIMMLAGYLMDAFNPQKKTTTEIKESTKTETKQITSKIETTNKQLELVNRNLIAMRSDLTYIMQQSYYFRERNTEDRFAIDSQRGNM